jgi:hypothetical protein
MDLAVKNKQESIIGYIVNVQKDVEHIAKNYAKDFFKHASKVEEIESLNIPKEFAMCAMDRQTANNLVLMNPKI